VDNIQFSIDLETLGLSFNAPVIAIGVAAFNIDDGTIFDKFYLNVDWHSNVELGRALQPGTMQWWLKQSEEARLALINKNADGIPLPDALTNMHTWMLGIEEKKRVKPWGNGATFDISILEHAFQGCKLLPPWEFWNIRDMRTIVDVAAVDKNDLKREGTHHNALDDAVFQAEVISRAWRKLRGTWKC